MKTIGIVAEGPRDFEMFSAVIRRIMGGGYVFRQLQPEQNAISEFMCGWKGVWKWCEQKSEYLEEYLHSITPNIDLLILHMDGDVSRCEREVHCSCQRETCGQSEEVHPLYCDKLQNKNPTCPIKLPCIKHGTNDYSGHLLHFMYTLLGEHDDLPICYTVPCDSTDSWIVAAFDEYDDYENLKKPWESIIARSMTYHGIRITGRPQKKKVPYSKLIETVCEKWDTVINKCPQARRFQDDITRLLT